MQHSKIDKTGTIIPTGARDPIECMAFNVEMNLLAFATNCEVHIYLLTTVKSKSIIIAIRHAPIFSRRS